MTAPRVLVHDGNPDALARRVDAAQRALPDHSVVGTPSATAILVVGAVSPPETPVFVDLCASDRLSLDRPGERIIERLARSPATSHVRPIAWSAYVGADIVAGAREAGAAAFVTATLDRDAEADELRRAAAGEAVWPAVSAPAGDWAGWFATTYSARWEPWMEPVLVRLATTGERRSVAAELVAAGAARSATHAATRMREVARIIAGEHNASPTIVAQRAAITLARLAQRTPLSERPAVTMSLALAADALRTAPSLAVAAGLSALDVEDLLALDTLIREQPEANRGVGAPHADRARAERRWAAGRRALEHGAGVDDIDGVITAILRRTDRALVAIDDAQLDAERHPAARAAAALSAVVQLGGGAPEGLAQRAGAVTWQGRTPAQLALDGGIDPAELRAFTLAADAWLAARALPGS